ncbi:ATP-binding cassette domain-containing protein [Granulicoccus sp. GXG6511]|uniref:ATP-binding cassette domain-containing protein n=1 Tax=Granulicoccus sp. GXG6511 TaxID=3381351 RepID=UPI003D7CE03C
MSIVSILGLTLRIPTRLRGRPATVHAATDVSLSLEPGRVHALIGESGSGKSVLASTLNGLLPPGTIARGTVEVDGVDVTPALGHPRHRAWTDLRGRVVGSVAQSAATAFTPMRTVRSQLAEAVDALGGLQDPDELAATASLPAWALDAYPHELSGGLIGRAALAAALAGQPSVLVADEPTASLDRSLATRVLSLLREQADAGVGVLLITHDLGALLDGARAARPLVDDVSVMYAGRLVEQGPADAVWTNPEHAFTRALLAALPRNGLHPVPGDPPALTDLDERVRFEDRLVAP